jgi:hypothetical protein
MTGCGWCMARELARLRREGIVFKQVPYEIQVR